MKPEAILYTSNTGFTRQYAELLAQKTGLPAYAFGQERGCLRAGCPVIYMGWLMAGKVKGYAKAARKYRAEAVCGVGMGASGSQLDDLRKANVIPEGTPVFTLQGGFELSRLRGVYRLMMTIMSKTVGKQMANKADRTPEEDDMLELMLHGGSRVSEDNLSPVLDWYRGL